jgi:hypothetical protein
VHPALKLGRARLSPKSRSPLFAYGALAATAVATFTYPLVLGPGPATADPAATDPVAIGLQLANTQLAIANTQGQVDQAVSELRQRAVSSYIDGGSARAANEAFQETGGYDTAMRNAYLSSLTGDTQNTVHHLLQARSDLKNQEAKLQDELRTAEGAVYTMLGGTPQDPSAGGSPVINGPVDFAIALLRTLGAPLTPTNVQAIVTWHQMEGGAWNSPALFNPLNTSMRMAGSHGINGAGVQAYTSWTEGLTATMATLNNGAYSGIVAALRAGSSAQAVYSAISSSPWGTHF